MNDHPPNEAGQEDDLAQALRLCGEFERILEREAAALQELDFPALDEVHAQKGAVRLRMEEVTDRVILKGRGRAEHPQEEASGGEVAMLRGRLRRLLFLQKKNEELACSMKGQVAEQLAKLSSKRAAAHGYHETGKVSPRHVDITK